MEYLVLFSAVGVFLLIVFLREASQAKQREKKFIASLYQDYGKLPDKEYPLERYARMGSFYERHHVKGQVDDITWNDLNMDEIFKRMNYTFSASGEEYLYYTLRNSKRTAEELEHLEEVVRFFAEHADERVKIQYRMRVLGHTGKYSLYDYLDNLDILGKRSNRKHIILNCLFVPFTLLMFWSLPIALMGMAFLICYNIVTYFKEKNEIDPYITSFAYVVRLMNECEQILQIKVPVCEAEWKSMKMHLAALKGIKEVLSGCLQGTEVQAPEIRWTS